MSEGVQVHVLVGGMSADENGEGVHIHVAHIHVEARGQLQILILGNMHNIHSIDQAGLALT